MAAHEKAEKCSQNGMNFVQIGWKCSIQSSLKVQLNPALTDFKGPTFFFCYMRNFVIANKKMSTRPDTWPISSCWRVARGSMGQGGGCNVAGQGQFCSEIIISFDFASSKFSRYGQTDLPRDTPSYIESLSQRLKML